LITHFGIMQNWGKAHQCTVADSYSAAYAPFGCKSVTAPV